MSQISQEKIAFNSKKQKKHSWQHPIWETAILKLRLHWQKNAYPCGQGTNTGITAFLQIDNQLN